ncbi:hypothetical protein DRQ32_05490, partial [bacterium]
MEDEFYSGIDNLEVLAVARNYNRFLADAVLAASGGSSTALDFGAGTGTGAQAVRERGLDVACVEPDPRLRARLLQQGFPVAEELATIDDRSQAFIYTLNVLEHIEDDRHALRLLFEKLQPQGRLYVYVPAFAVLFSSMDVRVGHFRRYERSELSTKARDVGFIEEKMEYVDSLGFAAGLLYRLIGSGSGQLSPGSVKFYDQVVFPVSRVLDRIGFSSV